jgi:uncharacterized membrane protein
MYSVPVIYLIIVGILLILGIVLAVVLVCVLLATRRKTRAMPAPTMPVTAANNPEARNQRREAILERLAKKEISSEEAEQQLLALDNPLPEQMPVAPPPPRNGCGSGCLVAVICGIVIFVLLILVLLGSFFFMRTNEVRAHAIRTEEMR